MLINWFSLSLNLENEQFGIDTALRVYTLQRIKQTVICFG